MAIMVILDPIFAHLVEILARNFFSRLLPQLAEDIVPNNYAVQFRGKLMNESWENSK